MAEQYRPQHEQKEAAVNEASVEAAAQQKKLERERSAEQSGENKQVEASEARAEVNEVFEDREPSQEVEAAPRAPEHHIVTPKEKEVAFKTTMRTIQQDMTPSSRKFSQFIHNPVVENVSDFTGKTIARPNSILFGSIGAFFIVLVVYLMARYIGFRLSGSEFILVFIFGWFCGLLFDLGRKLVTGK